MTDLRNENNNEITKQGAWNNLLSAIQSFLGGRIIILIGFIIDALLLVFIFIVTKFMVSVINLYEVFDFIDKLTIDSIRILLSISLLVPMIIYIYKDIKALINPPK